MDIFYEKPVPKTATHLTENEFVWMNRILGGGVGISVNGIYKNTNDAKFINLCLTEVKRRKERYKDNPDYRKNSVEMTDEDVVSLIKEYGEISHSLELSGYITKSFSHTLEVGSEILETHSADDILMMDADELEEHFSFDMFDVEDDYEDLESVDANEITTTLKVLLPTPDFFAELIPEKKVA